MLLSIALLCMAVFGQYTAHFAKTASQPFRLTPCRLKVAAVAPTQELQRRPRLKRAARPGDLASALPFRWKMGLGLASTAAELAAANEIAIELQVEAARSLNIPPQRLPYVLRV